LLIKPGMTGLAQVRLPADTDLESVRKKLAYDLWYLQHGNLWLDLRILAATLLKLVGCSFGLIRILLALPWQHVIDRAYVGLPGLSPQTAAEPALTARNCDAESDSANAFASSALQRQISYRTADQESNA
jgi:hypothetical protein